MTRMVLAAGLGWFAVAGAGCGPSEKVEAAAPGKHLVRGKVVVPKTPGSVGRLAGGLVRFESAANPGVVAVAALEADGSFSAATVAGAAAEAGVPPGDYLVRIEPPRGDDGRPQVNLLPVKYQDAKKSGLRVTVPAAEELVITLPPG